MIKNYQIKIKTNLKIHLINNKININKKKHFKQNKNKILNIINKFSN